MLCDDWHNASPTKNADVLRTTLKILGLTQKQFAERLGIASVTLEKFLNGDTAISENLASRISAETGVDFAQLLTNSEPENPRSLDGSPLSRSKDGTSCTEGTFTQSAPGVGGADHQTISGGITPSQRRKRGIRLSEQTSFRDCRVAQRIELDC